MTERARPVRRVLALGLLLVLSGATPAAADAAEPGDYSSEVTSVEPDPGGFDIRTAGGDAFLELSVDEGVEVVVLGYSDEPYLRFSADGTVEQNRNSPATYINEDRTGTNALAPEALQGVDPTTLEPDWEEVADDGTHAWHDHRTHEMRPEAPVGRGESYPWSDAVPLEVDGQEVLVDGEITFHDTVTPLPWYLLALLVVGGLAVAGPRVPVRLLVGGVALAGLAAVAVAWAGYADQPPDTGASVVPIVVAAVAAVAALAGALLARVRTVALLVGAVFLATWGVFRLAVLANPVLPTSLPFVLERLATALALGVGLGAVVSALRSGALTAALLPLTDDGADEGRT